MASSGGSGDGGGGSSGGGGPQDKCLLTILVDVSPSEWGERNIQRDLSDKRRVQSGRRSIGPAKLEEDVLPAVLAFGLAFSSLNRENCLVVVAVAGNEMAVVYPRKGRCSGAGSMGSMVNDSPEMCGSKVDARKLHDWVRLGITELVTKATEKTEENSRRIIEAAAAAEKARKENTDDDGSSAAGAGAGAGAAIGLAHPTTKSCDGAAIAAGLSLSLCCINRFMSSALRGSGAASAADALLKRREDDGVLAMISRGSGKKKAASDEREAVRRARGMLSPRVLIIQATEDRTRDYNAFMNCAFAAVKEHVVIDGCFLPSGDSKRAKTSTFLEQACDRTSGVFLSPHGAAQVEGALLEVMVSVFLAPVPARKWMNLPKLDKVDFRARCFETGQSVDVAHVCNQCLSIFKNRPVESCPTCGAQLYDPVEESKKKKKKDIEGGNNGDDDGNGSSNKRARIG